MSLSELTREGWNEHSALSRRLPLPEGSFLAFDPPGGRVKSVNRCDCVTQKPDDLQSRGRRKPE